MLAGIDIGGTKTAVVLSTAPPQTEIRLVFPTDPDNGPEPALKRIIENLSHALRSRGLSPCDLAAIGVSCGGPLDVERGLIQSPPNLKTWNDVPICQILENQFQTRCYLENDANAGALAEARFGAGRGAKDLVFLTMGTGIGAGLIMNGELQRGASHAAGEIGHVRLTRTGPSGFGKVGTAEGWASGAGMARVARMYIKRAIARGESTLLTELAGNCGATITAREVAEAARKGDAVAQRVVKAVGEKLGEAMAILIDVINPERIIVGGLALRFGEDLLNPARERMRKEALASSADRCLIVPAALGEQIGDIAALCVAIQGMQDVSKETLRCSGV